MSDWVTVKEFILPQDAYIAQGRLESEGIQTFLKDELTIQTDNFLSNAIGGVKLQVLPHDTERAREILKDGGFIDEEPVSDYKFFKAVDGITKKFPFIGNSLFELRLLVLALLVLLLLIVPLVFFLTPSDSEKLTDGRWCLEGLMLNNREKELEHDGIVLVIGCKDYFEFEDDGKFKFSNGIEGFWEIYGSNLVLEGFPQEENFDGIYSINFIGNKVRIRSRNTVFIGRKARNFGY